MSLKYKFFILFLVVSIIPLAAAGFLIFENTKDEVTAKAVEQLTTIADVQEKRINEVLDSYLTQVRLVTTLPELQRAVTSYNEAHDEDVRLALEEVLRRAQYALPQMRAIAVYDTDGHLVAATNESYFTGTSALPKERVAALTLDEIFKDAENQLRVRLFGPVVSGGATAGAVEVIMSADPFVAVTEDHAGLGETGEIMLITASPLGDVLFLTPLRFDASAALTRGVSKEQAHNISTKALSGVQGTFTDTETTDYRGENVFAAVRQIESLGWGIVVKIDRKEALQSVTALGYTFLVIVSLTALAIIFTSFFIARSVTKPIGALTLFAQKLQQGNFTARTQIAGKNEIGILADSLNTAASEVVKLRSELEGKVEARTKELEASRDTLQESVVELEKVKKASLNILEDLTNETEKLKEKEKELASAKAYNEAVLLSLGDGLVATGQDGNIVFTNKAFEKLLGWKESDVQGKKLTDVIELIDAQGKPVPPEKRFIYQTLTTKKSSTTTAATVQYKRKDGTTFPVSIIVSPILLEDKIVGAVEVFRDITKEKEIDQAKTEFVSLASHQLRTPLSTVNWYAEMLIAGDAGKINDEQQKYLEEIYTGNQRMVELVNSLLDVSRLELGTFTVEPEPTDIVKLAESVIKEQMPQVRGREIRLTKHFTKELPDISVDPKLLRMVFQNLLSNAVKYTPKGGAVAMTIDREGEDACITVADTGWGIPKEEQDKIFSKLFRATNVREQDTEGTGLGLYIVKSVIEHSGGSIHFESPYTKEGKKGTEEVQGAKFFVRLPLVGMKEKKGTKRLT